MERASVLIVEDKETMLHLLQRILGESYRVEGATDGAQALALLSNRKFDVVLTDVRMPGADGFEVLRAVKRQAPETEVILMTAYASIPKAAEAVREGAYDYLEKPFDPDDVSLVVARALERRRQHQRASALEAELDGLFQLKGVFGQGAWARVFQEQLQRAAASRLPVLVVGEVGTGRERVARALHQQDGPAERPFVAVDCATLLPASSVQGPAADTFSAVARLREALAQARGGTLWLSEVEALSPPLQAELERALLPPTTARALGPLLEDARLVASAGRSLTDDVAQGRFSVSLYARLTGVVLTLPALRARREDIAPLAQRLLQRHARPGGAPLAGFEPEALQALTGYDWPGNVAELEAAVAHAASIAAGERIRVDELPLEVARALHGLAPGSPLLQMPYREVVDLARDRASRDYLIALLSEFGGNVTHAAEHAGMERESLHRLLKRFNLKSEDYKGQP